MKKEKEINILVKRQQEIQTSNRQYFELLKKRIEKASSINNRYRRSLTRKAIQPASTEKVRGARARSKITKRNFRPMWAAAPGEDTASPNWAIACPRLWEMIQNRVWENRKNKAEEIRFLWNFSWINYQYILKDQLKRMNSYPFEAYSTKILLIIRRCKSSEMPKQDPRRHKLGKMVTESRRISHIRILW